MKNFIGGAGARVALAAILAAAVTAAIMMAVRPAAAQASPRVVMLSSGGGSIGVNVRDVTAEDAAKAKMAQPAGVYIDSVREGSPAGRAGLQAGDVVIDFDGERVRSATHFARLVQESVPNRQVAAIVVRGTSKQTLNVIPEASGNLILGDVRRRLQELPRDFNLNIDPDRLRRALPVTGGTLGISVSPLSDQLASYFGVKQGVLVNGVTANSPAATAGVRAGDVITAINGQTVSSSGDVTRALRENRGEAIDIAVTRDRTALSLKATVPQQNVPAGRSGRSGLPV